jgi:hypothetical protein
MASLDEQQVIEYWPLAQRALKGATKRVVVLANQAVLKR